MLELSNPVPVEIGWPVALAIAWAAGEIGQRWLHMPRISGYGIAGFGMAASQGGFISDPSGGPIALLAHLSFALLMFELGYRINLGWLRSNPWLMVTSLAEAGGAFLAVFVVAQLFAVPTVLSLILASLTMSTSPAAVLRVANDLKGSGQVTERTLHLSAFNCILAVLIYKVIIGYWVLANAGSLSQALWNSVVVVLISASLGALFGVLVPALLRAFGATVRYATVSFAVALVLLTALTSAFKFSPLLAALAFGGVARHRQLVLSAVQRSFGALGDLLTILLFVFVAATLDWRHVVAGIGLALGVVGARMVAKMTVTSLFARLSGTSWRKGFLTGLALTPVSVFAILLLEQTRHLRVPVLDDVAGLAAIVLILEVIGPWATHLALTWAGETSRQEEL